MPPKNARRNRVSVPKRRIRGKGNFDEFDDPDGPMPARSKKESSDVPSTLKRIEAKLNKSIASAPGGPGAALGRIAGNFLGQGDLGASAGSALSKYLGFGDYNVVTNSLIKGADAKSTQLPTFEKNGRRGIRLTEREYLGDLTASATIGAFKNQSFRINPADPATFPWLSTVAAQFEEWEPLGLVFQFVSTSSEFNGASQALGTVITATDYDPTDPAYPNKLIMESADYAKSTKASNSLEHGIECEEKERPTPVLYTSISAPTVDVRLNDLGNFQIASMGCSAASVNLGEIWVTYDIAFYKKQLVAGQVGGTVFDYVIATGTTSGSTTALPFGLDTASGKFGSLPITVVSDGAGSTKLTFPPNMSVGTYDFNFIGTAVTSVNLVEASVNPLSNAVKVATLPGGVSTSAISGSGTTQCSHRCTISLTGPGAVVEISGVIIVGAASCQLRVLQILPVPFPVRT